jgi:hypothetical protein
MHALLGLHLARSISLAIAARKTLRQLGDLRLAGEQATADFGAVLVLQGPVSFQTFELLIAFSKAQALSLDLPVARCELFANGSEVTVSLRHDLL